LIALFSSFIALRRTWAAPAYATRFFIASDNLCPKLLAPSPARFEAAILFSRATASSSIAGISLFASAIFPSLPSFWYKAIFSRSLDEDSFIAPPSLAFMFSALVPQSIAFLVKASYLLFFSSYISN
jgi:hypothetical protein